MAVICPSNFIKVIQEAFKTDLHPGGAAVHGVFGSIGHRNQPAKLVDLVGEPSDVGANPLQMVLCKAENVRYLLRSVGPAMGEVTSMEVQARNDLSLL